MRGDVEERGLNQRGATFRLPAHGYPLRGYPADGCRLPRSSDPACDGEGRRLAPRGRSASARIRTLGSRSLWTSLVCAVSFFSIPQIATGAEATTDDMPVRGLPFEVVDGWAVHAGDIVLGRVEDLLGPIEHRVRGLGYSDGRSPRFQPATSSVALWDQGRIPYVINPDFSQETHEQILAAITEWNRWTVITLVERTSERDYVRFQTTTERCRSHVGKKGGEQAIWWVQSGNSCGGTSFLLHEIGHTVGLWHEHQRTDRNEFLTVRKDGILQSDMEWIVGNDHPAEGPYDYASVMHYHPLVHSVDGLPVLETIPPGIPIRSSGDRLSQGDRDRVARLYGANPQATTITTNPPGLNVIVNGVPVKTPSTHFWQHGIVKSLGAPLLQESEGTRFVFARWTRDRARVHNMTVGEGGTWVEANYIVQHKVSATPHPAEGGTVTIEPPSTDGYYTQRTALTVRPSANSASGYQFWKWGLWRNHGLSAQPAQVLVGKPDQFAAHFTTGTVFRISSTVGPFGLYVNDEYQFGPVALHPDQHGESVQVSVPEVQTRASTNYRPTRYYFEGWTDGGPPAREVSVREGGELVARLRGENSVHSGIVRAVGGSVIVDPPAPGGGGYDPRGAIVRWAGVPNEGWEFVEWLVDPFGREPAVSVEGDGSRSVSTVFARVHQKRPAAAALATVPMEYSFPVRPGQQGFLVSPPIGARQVTIRFEPSESGAAGSLLAFTNEPGSLMVSAENAEAIGTSADRSAVWGGGRTIVLSADSTPTLNLAQTYGFRFVSPHASSGVAGTVRVEFDTGATAHLGQVSPRALTFVAPTSIDAPSQQVTVANLGPDIVRFRFSSDTPWLSAEPREGTLQPYRTVEVAVRTHSVGLAPDTYRRELRVEVMDDAGKPIGIRSVKIAFAVIPPSDTVR